METTARLNVLDIYLDEDNPRHDPINNQQEIIKFLLQKEQVKALARDITKYGTSPLDNVAVLKNKKGECIALEGNRRICALQLLNDPERAPTAELANYFRKLAENSPKKIPKSIQCVIYKKRADADVWLERRHSSDLKGAGLKQWNAEQKTRHNTKRGKKDNNALAQVIIDYAKSKGFISQDISNNILTTASRFLGNPYFRETIGVVSQRSDPEVIIDVPYDEFDKVVKQFCKDLVKPNSDVHSRTNKQDWVQYSEKLVKKGIAPENKIDKQKLSERNKPNNNNTQQSNKSNSNTTTSSDPNKRPHIIPNSFRTPREETILRRIAKEMKRLNVQEDTLAVTLLTRTFLENIYSRYYEKLHGYKKLQSHLWMKAIINHLDDEIKKDESFLNQKQKSALQALNKIASNTNNVLNPKTLGANAHGSIYPSAKEVLIEWDNISSIVEYFLKNI